MTKEERVAYGAWVKLMDAGFNAVLEFKKSGAAVWIYFATGTPKSKAVFIDFEDQDKALAKVDKYLKGEHHGA